jgi:hypothetical protein
MENPFARSIALRAALGAVVLATLPALTCADDDGAMGAMGAMSDDGTAVEAAASEPGEAAAEPAVLTGVTSREAIEEADPVWAERVADAEIDEAAAEALASVPPGAEITVFLGTWCSDSRREVPRFWRALDHLDHLDQLDPLDPLGGEIPFEIEYVAVDRHKEQPADRIAGADIHYVPTFIVRRDGEEAGRVVESSPNGIESDLLALLTGEASGVVSGRDDL